jgi:hypothetical protein
MVQVFMNRYLAEEYSLGKYEDVLETPLDSYATKKLREIAGRGKLPRWEGIIKLKPEASYKYQEYASMYAKEVNIPRACLDTILWRVE